VSLRPQYEDEYYAAFVIDPDGHNIETVYSEKAKYLSLLIHQTVKNSHQPKTC